MNRNKLWLITVSLVLLLASGAEAQKSKSQKPAKKPAVQKTKTTQKPAAPAAKKTAEEKTPPVDATEDEKKVRDMVAFLEYMLNTLGNSATSNRDKDVLINESFSKVFRDAKVQVEDDLDEERDVITNKDVVAYMKDVDFFFKDVKFEFTIESIKSGTMAGGKHFYKVSLRRNLSGTTSEGNPVNNTMPRYIEVNFDPDDQDLKIVSIYTNEFDQREALTSWWKELSYEWQAIFRRKLNLTDSVAFSDIQDITAIEELDLSDNKYIQNIEPLAQLPALQLLNLSHTGITDLTPIRNLTELVELNVAHTPVKDLAPLKYSSKLVRLNISHTQVNDITVVEKMPGLQNLEVSATPLYDLTPMDGLTGLLHLDLSLTPLYDLSPLANLTQLMELNIAGTAVRDLNTLKGFVNLAVLNVDSTRIENFSVLSSLQNLKELHANQTLIVDLQPLQKLTRLEKIYCDQTPITRARADAFMAANPRVLVVFDSKDLKLWWDSLVPEWQNILSKTANIGLMPTKEELARVTNLDSVNFSGNRSVQSLEPLRRLLKLRVLLAGKTSVKDLSPLHEHREIRHLDISDTEVSDLSVTRQFTRLKVLAADRSKIESIEPLYGVSTLDKLYADQTVVHDITARELLEKNPRCLIVHKTVHLNRWWKSLSPDWKEVFRAQMGSDTTTTRENLHRLAEQEKLHFKDAPVNDLSALSEFVRLKELHFSGTAIHSIPPLENIRSLRSLHATSSPLQQIGAVGLLTELEDLDISNTPVDELKPIGALQQLRRFNCAGTQIKKLDPLERMENLEYLDCSNTRVTNLDPVAHLSLKTLKCYNTKVSGKEVENFKKSNPECNVVYYR